MTSTPSDRPNAKLTRWIRARGPGARARLAERLGVSPQAVSLWCSGRSRPADVLRQRLFERMTPDINTITPDEWLTAAELRDRVGLTPDGRLGVALGLVAAHSDAGILLRWVRDGSFPASPTTMTEALRRELRRIGSEQ